MSLILGLDLGKFKSVDNPARAGGQGAGDAEGEGSRQGQGAGDPGGEARPRGGRDNLLSRSRSDKKS